MRVDREKLKIFIMNLRIREVADEEKLSDSQLVEMIANYLENDPGAVNVNYKKPKPFWENDSEPYNYD